MSNESTVIFAMCEKCDESDCECEEGYKTYSTQDILGNKISGVYNFDDGLIDFYIKENKVPLTTWSVEDDPELCLNDFVNNWNASQKATLESIKLTDHTAEFILKAMCDGSYSSEDVDMVSDELKHVEVWLQNIAETIKLN
tara:strand:- start:438 stop:860 length:423 start_codon:yes stop_codon:yes gene_type:complete